MGVSYKGGNLSDIVKHSNLEKLVSELVKKKNKFTYIEFHSGPGKYYLEQGDYEGSCLRVLNKIRNIDYEVFLHEKDENTRKKLIKNISEFSSVIFRKEWESYIDEYIENEYENPLFLIDPNHNKDYDKLLEYIPCLLEKGIDLFMYVPEGNFSNHRKIIDTIRCVIKDSKRESVDLMHPSDNVGCYRRIDHNFAVSSSMNLYDVIENHMLKRDIEPSYKKIHFN